MVYDPLLKYQAAKEAPLPKDLIHLGAEDNHGLGMFNLNSGGTGGQAGQVAARQPWPSLPAPHFSIDEVPLLKSRAAVEPPPDREPGGLHRTLFPRTQFGHPSSTEARHKLLKSPVSWAGDCQGGPFWFLLVILLL